jgi:hypothetical protein
VPGRPRGWRNREGLWLTAAGAVLTLVFWGRVVIGQRFLVAGDVLYGVPPWLASRGAHAPANPLVSDTVVTTLAWTTVVHDAFWHLRWPLWNQLALSGSPLFANDQTSALYPVTLLTLPFSPAHALSLAMLGKMWIAGLGTAFFIRQLGGGARAAFFGGVAFATSSYMVVWLGYPNATAASLLPLGFAAVEWYLRSRRPLALALVAFDIGMMFLAGHAPSEFQLLGMLAVYTAVRLLAPCAARLRTAATLVAAGVVGGLVGAVQVLPFLEALTQGVTFNLRTGQKAGAGHLLVSSAASWFLPNSHGNPAIDGLFGRPPNYAESAGFAGVGALVLGVLGTAWLWRQRRSAALGLLIVVALAAGVVYGPLTPLASRLPILAVSNNARLIAVVCFGIAVLGGLGVEYVLNSAGIRSTLLGRAGLVVGAISLLSLGASWLAFWRLRGGVDSILPTVHGNIGFWIAIALLSLSAAVALVAAGAWGGQARLATGGLLALALVEAMFFAWPYNPSTRPAEVPPKSAAVGWLRAHAGDGYVAAAFPALIPESASLYGLRDVGGYDLVVTPRTVAYWTAADPGFEFKDNHTNLSRPQATWLAAAGVSAVVVPGDVVLPGTSLGFHGEGVSIDTVPNPRPFAYAARETVAVADQAAAAEAMRADPEGPVAVESDCCAGSQGAATVGVLERSDGLVRLRVDADAATTVVVGQEVYPGWKAEVDGAPADIRAANILFQSVRVPGGRHELTLRYTPQSFLLGGLLTLLGLVAIAGLLVLDRLRR